MQKTASMEAISLLYEQDAQPVIGVSGRTVRFLNQAARTLFGDVIPGTAIRRLLPEHVALHQASAFFATAKIKGQAFCVVLSSMPGLRIFRLVPVRRDVPFPHILVPSDLFSLELGLSSAYFSASAAEREDLTFRHYAARLEHATDQLRRWVQNASTLQQLLQGGVHPAEHVVDCAALTGSILENVQTLLDRRGIRVSLTLPESACGVRMSPELYETLLLNLLSNAIKSCRDNVTVSLTKGTRTVHLRVHDTGSGFPDGVLTDIFHAYSMGVLPHTRQQHAGYGLPVCFAAAEDLGGSLLIESSRGSGAAVQVMLPLAASGNAILHAPAKPDAQECARDFRIALSDALSDDDYYSENN